MLRLSWQELLIFNFVEDGDDMGWVVFFLFDLGVTSEHTTLVCSPVMRVEAGIHALKLWPNGASMSEGIRTGVTLKA